MKKVSLLIALFIAIGAFAQKRGHNKKDNFTPEQKTQLIVMKLSVALDLSEKQEAKITPIIAEKVSKMKERMAKSKKGKRSERKEISNDEKFEKALVRLKEQKALQNKMKNILNKDQYAQWKKMQKKHTPKKGKMNNRKGRNKKKKNHRQEESEA